MTWIVELTVADHEQEGFVHLAQWSFPTETEAREFIDGENAAVPNGAEPDHLTEPFTFILDLYEGPPNNDLVDNSKNLPMQSAMRLAPDQVRHWLEERPEPDAVIFRWVPRLPTPAQAKETQ